MQKKEQRPKCPFLESPTKFKFLLNGQKWGRHLSTIKFEYLFLAAETHSFSEHAIKVKTVLQNTDVWFSKVLISE